jgi:glutamate N-acetyltransferase/amino-acid N-acetyltransferase
MLSEFKIATANCGLKYKNRDDLLLVVLPSGASSAGVFTSSSMPAACVSWSKQVLQNPNQTPRALIVNAGNANAFTGEAGEAAILEIAQTAANLLGCLPNQVLNASTGVIGEPLKFELITKSLPQMVESLRDDEKRWLDAAKAIMTTDTKPKLLQKTCEISGQKVNLVGFAKGSGMIAPNMATMLGYVFCDANLSSMALQELLKEAVDGSFNSITVDSDQSTNDMVLAFAHSCLVQEKIDDANSAVLGNFKLALNQLCLELAKMIVIDGEGAKKLIEIEILGASSKIQAKEVAFGIANSPLVKTAIAGCDPNWGRIVMAIGKSCKNADMKKLKILIGEQLVAENGARCASYNEEIAHNYLKNAQVKILVDLALGNDSSIVWTCDLNEEYIHINKDYRS